MHQIHVFPDKKSLCAPFLAFMQSVFEENGRLNIALSGGSTPKVLFQFIAENAKASLDWEGVHFFFGDERCVPPEHSESNYRMAKETLLDHIAVPAVNIHRIKGEANPTAEAARYAQVLADVLPHVNDIPQFDLVMLGLGDDGHTVSIFPHQIALWNSDRSCEVATHPESGQQRVTITGKVVNAARYRAFLVTGAGKSAKVKAILEGGDAAKGLPGALVNTESLHWFLDKAAYQ